VEHLKDQDLQLYLDRQLEDADKLSHLRGCPVCQERLDAYEPLFAGLAAAPEWSPSPAMTRRVMRKIKRETLGPLYENLLNVLLIVGGFIAALNFALPYLHAEEYITTARKLQLPHFSVPWDQIKELNFLPKITALAGEWQLPVNTLLMVTMVLALVAVADQLITHARGKAAPHNR
jgi:hypothetical protein